MLRKAPPVPPLRDREWQRFRLGLDRITMALARLGHPHRRFDHVLVGGTNGKGTVCWNLARHLPGPVGVFLSPHLVDVRERILIDGCLVPDAFWQRAFDRISAHVGEIDLSYFEWLVLIAVDIFVRHDVRWGVFEVGLGGRFDATNGLDPRVSAITNVGLDHQAILGDTLGKIALEKIEIARPHRPLVIPHHILAYANVAARLAELNPEIHSVRLDPPPRYQHNQAIVAAILTSLGMPCRVSDLVSPLGRRSYLPIGAGVFLDGAHNAMAWADTAKWIAGRCPGGIRLVCGLSEGRDPKQFLAFMKPVVSDIVVWCAGFDRELPPSAWPSGTTFVSTEEVAGLLAQPLLVCGSLYLLGRFLEEFQAPLG